MLLRRIARPLLATPFVVDGVNTLLHPEARAKKLIQLEPRTKNTFAAKLTDDPTRLVRITAASQTGAALLLALGRAPRIAALVLAANVVPALATEQDFWAEDDPDRRIAKRTAFLKDAGLLGGLMLAAADTEGRPSLGWRGRRAARDAAQAVSSMLPIGALAADDTVARRAREATHAGRALAERARNQAADLTDTVREHGPHWAEAARNQAADLTDTVRERGPRWAEVARGRAADVGERTAEATTRLADFAGENAPVLADTVKDRGAVLARTARRRGTRLVETARDRGPELRDRGTELAESARHRLGR